MTHWVSLDVIIDAAYGAGYREEALAVAAAVTHAEAGKGAPEGMWADIEAIGDVNLENAVWGPSVGAWQVRTVKADSGTGKTRDRAALFGNLAKQAQSAYEISGGNTTTGTQNPNRGWGNWSTWNAGTHLPFLTAARKAAAARMATGGTGATAGGGAKDAFGQPISTPPTVDAFGQPILPTPANQTSPDVVIGGGQIGANFTPPRDANNISVTYAGGGGHGPGVEVPLGPYILDGTLDLTLGESSELSLHLTNPGRTLLGNGDGSTRLRGLVWWESLIFVIAAHELTADGPPGSGRVTLSCRDEAVDILKRTNLDAAGVPVPDKGPYGVKVPSGKDLSPTEYAELQTSLVSRLRFMGQGSPRTGDIAPTKNDKTGVYEAPWEVMQRLAGDLGYLCFVAGNVLYFAKPTWIARRAVEVKVGLSRAAWGDPALDIIGDPNYRHSVDDLHGATLTVKLPRWRGEQVRPGMVLVTKGMSEPIDVRGPDQLGDRWLVQKVSWPVDNGRAPVTIEAQVPVDPVASAATGPSTAATSATAPPPRDSYVWPAAGPITGKFGESRPGHVHEGLDLGIPVGSPVVAARAGRVTVAGPVSGYGNAIYIDHHDQTITRYGHLSEFQSRVGDEVAQGARIALSGNTGESTGPHLHFEIRPNDKAVDPLTLLPAR